MNKKPDPFLIDDDCPELTEADIEKMFQNSERLRRIRAIRQQKALTPLVPEFQNPLFKIPA
jgi:hypothetical protein